VVVLGDLNDEPTAATTQILLGPPGSEIGTPGFERADQGDGSRLWNLAPLIPAERRFSRMFRGRGELIDHILVSHELVQRVENVDTGPGEPRSITEDPTERRDEPRRITFQSWPASASNEVPSRASATGGREWSARRPLPEARKRPSSDARLPEWGPAFSRVNWPPSNGRRTSDVGA
jgi:hypothetical protein